MTKFDIYIKDNPIKEELDEILEWLRVEKEINGEGFYCNKDIINEAFLNHELIVLKCENESVGLAVWTKDDVHVDLDIFVIKPDCRGQGYGEFFYNAISKYFSDIGYFAIMLFCAPVSSERFWKRMGLVKFPECNLSYHELTYYDVLVETASTLFIEEADKIELWDIDHNYIVTELPKWTWYVEIEDDKFVYPIVHPCNCNWRIRWSNKGHILKECKVKYITENCMEYYYSPFLVLDETKS